MKHGLFHLGKQDSEAIFGSERNENGQWRRLQNGVNIVKVNKYRRLIWTGHVPRMDEIGSSFKILRGNHKGKRLLGRPRRGWEEILE